MTFDELSDVELEIFRKLSAKWMRKYPSFGESIVRALARETHRRQGLESPLDPIPLPALPRREYCKLSFSLIWLADDFHTGMQGKVGHMIVTLIQGLIEASLGTNAFDPGGGSGKRP